MDMTAHSSEHIVNEVKSEVIEDASGGRWEPLFKVLATLFYLFLIRDADARPQELDHILTVYRPLNLNNFLPELSS
jgi:hypothetical protein